MVNIRVSMCLATNIDCEEESFVNVFAQLIKVELKVRVRVRELRPPFEISKGDSASGSCLKESPRSQARCYDSLTTL